MKANKRVRDLKRRSARRLTYVTDGMSRGITTFPLTAKDKDGKQHRIAGLRIEWRG